MISDDTDTPITFPVSLHPTYCTACRAYGLDWLAGQGQLKDIDDGASVLALSSMFRDMEVDEEPINNLYHMCLRLRKHWQKNR